ncbi:hypothetical protein CL630_00025 [bacterium]|nr:hypothetical protein [bacterium]|tara:strand:+ start:2756 stop:3178 length:423 start_codon:yes stop_codon:yes gene_type:complete
MFPKRNLLIIAAVIVFLAIVTIADIFNYKNNGGHNGTQIIADNQEDAQDVAQSWIENSAPTYVFDGFNLKFIENKEGECAGCFVFTFTFESRHGGYGDREGLLVTQVITQHNIEIGVENGEVKSAITDSRYNELTGALAE